MFRKKEVERLKKQISDIERTIEEYMDIVEPHRYRSFFRKPSDDLRVRIKVSKIQTEIENKKEELREGVIELLTDLGLTGKPAGVNKQEFVYDGCTFHSAPEAAE